MLGITDSVIFSPERVEFEKMNILHNISDCCINLAYAEGFGLATLEAMQCAKPIIALKTGGLTRQVVDHRDGSENGVALDVTCQTMVGSQSVPYIFEDYCTAEAAADAILKIYEMSPEERAALGQKAKDYVTSEFNIQDTVDKWHDTMINLVEVIFVSSFNRLQNLVTFASSKGASTSSKTQIGAGFVKKTAKIKDMAVKACSPPESKVID